MKITTDTTNLDEFMVFNLCELEVYGRSLEGMCIDYSHENSALIASMSSEGEGKLTHSLSYEYAQIL